MAKQAEKKRVLVFGADGMLGFDLKKVFRADSLFTLVAVDKKDCDIVDLAAVKGLVKREQPDYIVNVAAFTQVDDCEDKKFKKVCVDVNGKGAGNIAKAAKEVGAIMVQVSTDYVFDGGKKVGYTERSRFKPVNQYGKSKAKGEELVKKYMRKFYIVRTSWLFGKNGGNFVETMIALSKKHPELKVVNDQRGKPTWTYDLAMHIAQLLKSTKPFGVYHFTNEGETTWYKFTREIMKQIKSDTKVKPCTSDEFPRPAKRPENSVLLNMKFKRMQHWKKALQEYLKEMKHI